SHGLIEAFRPRRTHCQLGSRRDVFCIPGTDAPRVPIYDDRICLSPGRARRQSVRARLLEALALPPDFWRSEALLDALAARDIAHLVRLVQKMAGASQTQIGMVTGLSQAQVSEIMSKKRQVTAVEVIARIVEGFGIPDPARTVLLLGSRRYLQDEPLALGTQA